MDFGILRIFEAILAAAGWKMAVVIMVIIVAIVAIVRMAPQLLADRRARDREDAMARQATTIAMQNRIDSKDAMVEKIMTNHIAHLEAQLSASREFYEIATERLSSLSMDMKEARHKLESVGMELAGVKEDTAAIRTLEENR